MISSWLTKINLKGCEEKAQKIAGDIKAKDPTFNFWIKEGYLFIESKDKDTAHKRGLLFTKKYLKECGDLGYESWEWRR